MSTCVYLFSIYFLRTRSEWYKLQKLITQSNQNQFFCSLTAMKAFDLFLAQITWLFAWNTQRLCFSRLTNTGYIRLIFKIFSRLNLNQIFVFILIAMRRKHNLSILYIVQKPH